MIQGSQGIRAPSSAPAGGTVEVTVSSGDREIWVSSGPNSLTRHRVPPNRRVTIPVPNLPGEVISVSTVNGSTVRTVLITIVAP